jgi:hypothetical protein
MEWNIAFGMLWDGMECTRTHGMEYLFYDWIGIGLGF